VTGSPKGVRGEEGALEGARGRGDRWLRGR
jgi:hypothetical protein